MKVNEVLKIIAPKFLDHEESETNICFYTPGTEDDPTDYGLLGELNGIELNQIDYEDIKNYPFLNREIDWIDAQGYNAYGVFLLEEGSEDLSTK